MRDLWLREKFQGKLMPVVNIALNLCIRRKARLAEAQGAELYSHSVTLRLFRHGAGLSFYDRHGWDSVWWPAGGSRSDRPSRFPAPRPVLTWAITHRLWSRSS